MEKTPEDRDSRGTPIERTPGPGPKDAGKGAARREAIRRVDEKPPLRNDEQRE